MHRILMAVGGSGGHLFPAIALAEELESKYGCKVEFAGGKLSSNPFVAGRKELFHEVSCGMLSKNPIEFLKQSFSLVRGVKQSVDLIRRFQPDVVIGFGSYHSLPLLIGSKLAGKKLFLHEGNTIPGKVNRLFAPWAAKTWIQFPSAQQYLKTPAALGGLPLRKELRRGAYTPEEARACFQLDPRLITLLVIGGSQGAKKLNALFSAAALFHLRELLPEFQVIHSTGSHEETELLMGRYVSKSIPAYVRPFIRNMAAAWSAASFSITRAGGASLAEQFEFEVPGIVIPYPFASDDHQSKNGDFLVQTGLGIKLMEEGMTPQSLAAKIQDFYIGAEDRISKFQAYKMAHPIPPLSEGIMEALECR